MEQMTGTAVLKRLLSTKKSSNPDQSSTLHLLSASRVPKGHIRDIRNFGLQGNTLKDDEEFLLLQQHPTIQDPLPVSRNSL